MTFLLTKCFIAGRSLWIRRAAHGTDVSSPWRTPDADSVLSLHKHRGNTCLGVITLSVLLGTRETYSDLPDNKRIMVYERTMADSEVNYFDCLDIPFIRLPHGTLIRW